MDSEFQQLQPEYDELMRGLSSRTSAAHLSHAVTFGFLGLLFTVTGAVLRVQRNTSGWHWQSPTAIALGTVALFYALGRGVVGVRSLARERVNLARARELGRKLGLDEQLPRLSR